MDPESRKLLVDTYKLTKENNQMLLRIRRGQRLAHISRIAYWIVIIGVSYGAYYYVQPYLNSLLGYYGAFTDKSGKITSPTDIRQLESLIKEFKK